MQRNPKGRILSFSPYMLYNNTNAGVYITFKYWYSNLSRQIHKCRDKRKSIEEKINKIIPITDRFTFRFFEEIYPYLEEDDGVRKVLLQYCNHNSIPMPSKQKVREMKNLIDQWRDISSTYHYCMTKQEKRKVKKIYKKTRGNTDEN